MKEPLARITFASFPTAHAVNGATASPDRLDLIIGFASADLVWFDPLSSRYVRLNKAGAISQSPVTAVKWVPGLDRMFLSAHQDGTILIFDRERDDPAASSFVPRKVALSPSLDSSIPLNGTLPWNHLAEIIASTPSWHSAVTPVAEKDISTAFSVSPKEEKKKSGKNPLSHWRISHKAILGGHLSWSYQKTN